MGQVSQLPSRQGAPSREPLGRITPFQVPETEGFPKGRSLDLGGVKFLLVGQICFFFEVCPEKIRVQSEHQTTTADAHGGMVIETSHPEIITAAIQTLIGV
jgi:hypothetical protein